MKNPFTVMKDKPKEFFELIPQTGVTHLFCEEDPQHNAVWDMAVSPEGRVFFAACGESYLALHARLYEYDHKNKKLIRHMALEEKILESDIALRTSKFHTALSFIGDGTILTTTNTTSPGPNQPIWMPYEYADHPYEAYPGSSLLKYNYLTGETCGLGVFTPYDTTYGATYDPKNGDYFAITWMRGLGYVYNVHTGERRCLGQVSDTHTSRTFLCSDGHIYGSTYSGAIFRYNTDIRDIEYLGVNANGLIRHAREIDGILYFTTGPCAVAGRGQELYAFNLKTREISTVGRPVPKADAIEENDDIFYNAYGMAFDSQNRMWYGVMTFIPEHKYVGARLYMWDFLNGKDPVDCGFLGTSERTISVTAEMHIVDDVLYISDGNHTSDVDVLCGVLAIDLEEFVPALSTEKRIMSHDYINYLPYQDDARQWYPRSDFDECLDKYINYYENTVKYYQKFLEENCYRYPFKHVSGVSVWEKVGYKNTAIHHIEWSDDNNFTFLCGNTSAHNVNCTIDKNSDAHVTSIELTQFAEYSECKADVLEIKLPAIAGRQYLAVAKSSIKLNSGAVLVGTHDTMLAKVADGRVFGLGQVCSAGKVHSMDICPDGTVYGVAGHEMGVGQLFTYTEDEGVRLLGLLPEAAAENGRFVCLYRPTTVAISPSGKYLAVGGADEIGGVIVLTLK